MNKTIVIKTTLNCNQRCEYCYEFRKESTNEKLSSMISLDEIKGILDRFARLFDDVDILWMFHGGEPLIAGNKYIEGFCDKLREINNATGLKYETAIQTNATMLSRDWIKAFEKNSDLLAERMLSISIDGPKYIHDSARSFIDHTPTFDSVMKAISSTESAVFTDIA